MGGGRTQGIFNKDPQAQCLAQAFGYCFPQQDLALGPGFQAYEA